MMQDYSLTVAGVSDATEALVGRISLITDTKFTSQASVVQDWLANPEKYSLEPRYATNERTGEKTLLGFQLTKLAI